MTRGGRAGRAGRGLLAAALALACASQGSAAEFLRRSRPLEEIAGRLDVRRSRMVRVPVPVDCPGGRRSGCVEEQTFDEVARFDFFLQRVAQRDGTVSETEAPSGTLLVAVKFSDRERIAFWDAVEAAARDLAAEAFVSPWAGWTPGASPFDGEAVVRTSGNFWGCYASAASHVVIHFTRPGRREGSPPGGGAFGTKRYASPPPRMCEAMKAATAGAPPETRRTLSSPLRTREDVVELREVLDHAGGPVGRERPAGATLRKEAAPVGMSAASAQAGEADESRAATRIVGGWRYDAVAGPVEMPWRDLASGAWLSEWSVRSIERRFGLAPEDQVIASTRVLVAVLATTLPVDEASAGSSQIPPPLDRSALLGHLGEALDRGAGAPATLVEAAFLGAAGGSIPAGWLTVVCRPDGSAGYAIPPTDARGRVTNAPTFCRALGEALR